MSNTIKYFVIFADCPGTQSEDAGKASACAGCPNQQICSSGATKGPDPGIQLVKDRLDQVKNKVLVLSGKGGVGKSTLTALLSRAIAAADNDKNVSDITFSSLILVLVIKIGKFTLKTEPYVYIM